MDNIKNIGSGKHKSVITFINGVVVELYYDAVEEVLPFFIFKDKHLRSIFECKEEQILYIENIYDKNNE